MEYVLFQSLLIKAKLDLTIVQTAGLVIAARLTEDPNVSVLVLEAGPANLNEPALRKLPPIVQFLEIGTRPPMPVC